MCGIVGYTGTKLAKDVLIEGLRRLEYRGYDSAGIALQEAGGLSVTRRVGKVEGLAEAVADMPSASTCGIGHTRWATHGAPSERNAHPHVSCDGQIAVVHNGIIENFQELREKLAAQGHIFKSDTDTEVVAHLVEGYYQGDLLAAVARATQDIIGAYGLAITCAAEPGRIVATRKDSPIVLAHGEAGSYVASDIIAVIEASRDVAVLGDGQLADMRPDGITYYNAELEEIEPSIMHVDWDVDVARQLPRLHAQGDSRTAPRHPRHARRPHDQRRAVDRRAGHVARRAPPHRPRLHRGLRHELPRRAHRPPAHRRLARIPESRGCERIRYRNPIITPSTLVVAVSQSGETADTLAAIREARIKGGKVFGITNVIGSPVARESDGVIYTKANKEIAVASTKSFLGQVVSLTLLSMVLAQAKGQARNDQVRLLFKDLADTAEKVEYVLADTKAVDEAARACKDATDAFFIGRGMGSATSYEGALKLKEISYVHAEAYPAGEMKHGPIALLEPGFPVIAVATQSPVYDKVVSNLQESRSRGAMIVAVATEGDEEIKANADHVIYIPKVRDAFMPIVASVPLQLFARSMAIARGCGVDKAPQPGQIGDR